MHFCFDFLVTKKEGKFKQGKIISGKVCETFLYSILSLVNPSYYNLGKVRSFSCANLVSFKIVVLFVLICIESTTILKETRFAQLSS